MRDETVTTSDDRSIIVVLFPLLRSRFAVPSFMSLNHKQNLLCIFGNKKRTRLLLESVWKQKNNSKILINSNFAYD